MTLPLLQVHVGLLPSPHLGLTLLNSDPSSPPWGLALAETRQAMVTITNTVSVSYLDERKLFFGRIKNKVFIDLNSLLVVIKNLPPTTRKRTTDPIMIVDFFILVH